MRKRIQTLLLVLCIMLTMLPASSAAADDSDAWGVRFKERVQINMRVGETYQLNYYFLPEGSTADVWFESSNDKVAKVDEKTGLITALNEGYSTVKAGLYWPNGKKNGANVSIDIRVDSNKYIIDFEIPETLTILRTDEMQMPIKFIPEGTILKGKLYYFDDGMGILQISDSGLITPIKPGTAAITVSADSITKKCHVTVVAEEGYMEPVLKFAPAITEGWYVIRCMYNFLNIDGSGRAELKWQNPAPTFYVKEEETGTTIKTADGKYLGLEGEVKNGAAVVAMSTPYFWKSYNYGDFNSFWVKDDSNPYMLMNASEGKNSDGTKIIVANNRNFIEPIHGKFQLVPANGPQPYYVRLKPISPYEEARPLNLQPSSLYKGGAKVYGLTIDQSTVGDMKALYGEPDDAWFDTYLGDDMQIAWYFYRNNWTDMMIIGATQPFDEELYDKEGKFQADIPISSDGCIIQGIYTNNTSFGLSTQPAGKLQDGRNIWIEYFKDIDGQTIGTYVGLMGFYFGYNVNRTDAEGYGEYVGSLERLIYYSLNGYLFSRGLTPVELDALGSFNKYKMADTKKRTKKVSARTYSKGNYIEMGLIEGDAWTWMMAMLSKQEFRSALESGKYNKISLGYAEGYAADFTNNMEEDDESVFGCFIAELGYQSGIEGAAQSIQQNIQNNYILAAPTNSKVYVNGKPEAFDAYSINGNNYFKLRDIAYVLNGTKKQFNVGWDNAANTIALTSRKAYTVVGGEMECKGGDVKSAAISDAKVSKDGKRTGFAAYKIENNNYFKLRDIGRALDFFVDWDEDNNAIIIDTSKGYNEG